MNLWMFPVSNYLCLHRKDGKRNKIVFNVKVLLFSLFFSGIVKLYFKTNIWQNPEQTSPKVQNGYQWIHKKDKCYLKIKKKKIGKSKVETRMHSSRIRTVRCSGHLLGGGVSPGGCLPRWAVSLEGLCLGGVCFLGGRVPARHPLPMNRIRQARKNITLPQLCFGR